MKNIYNLIAALLAVDAFLEKDGMVTLSAEQMQSIEDAIKSKDSIIASKESELQAKADELKSKDDAIKSKDERITELTGQVEALKASPGSTTSQVHEESGANGEKSDFEKYFESMQSARTLYDALP